MVGYDLGECLDLSLKPMTNTSPLSVHSCRRNNPSSQMHQENRAILNADSIEVKAILARRPCVAAASWGDLDGELDGQSTPSPKDGPSGTTWATGVAAVGTNYP
jgi:hypothetical protein